MCGSRKSSEVEAEVIGVLQIYIVYGIKNGVVNMI